MSDLHETKTTDDTVPESISKEETCRVQAAGLEENSPEGESTDAMSVKDAVGPNQAEPPAESCPTCGGGPAVLSPSVGGFIPASAGMQKVYALGTLGYDFSTEAGKDAVIQNMSSGSNIYDVKHMLAHLDKNPWDAGAIVWTLSINTNPIYAVLPVGPFATDGYKLLKDFLKAQVEEGAERISLPGIITGQTMLMSSGVTVPVVAPDIRGLYSWKTKDLVESLCGKEPKDGKGADEYHGKREGVRNLLDRIYYDLQNLGMSSQDRSLNFAATNAFNIEKVFEQAVKKSMQLQQISTEKSPICRPGSDCWDVKLSFWDPENQTKRARQVYRYTVDVSEPIPITVGPVRSWNE